LERLLGYYHQTKLTIGNLNGLLEDKGLRGAPRSSKKPGAIKLLYEATFPGEVLSLDSPDDEMDDIEVEKDAASCSNDGNINDDNSVAEGAYDVGDDENRESTAGEYLGHVSLEDFGNMAYFNSILQLLSSSKEILCFFSKNEPDKKLQLLSELSTTILQLNVLKGPHWCVSLRNLKRIFDEVQLDRDDDPFAEGEHHNPVEFLQHLVTCTLQERLSCSHTTASRWEDTFSFKFHDGSTGEVQVDAMAIGTSFKESDRDRELGKGMRKYLSEHEIEILEAPKAFFVVVDREGNDSRPVKFGCRLHLFEEQYLLRGTIDRHSYGSVNVAHYTTNVIQAMDATGAWIHCNNVLCSTVGSQEVLKRSQKEACLLFYEADTLDSTLEDFADVIICQVSKTQALDDAVVYANDELLGNAVAAMSTDQVRLQLKARGLPTDGLSGKRKALETRLRIYLACSQVDNL
jgi:hypothetical protein